MRKLTSTEAQDLCELLEERSIDKSTVFTTQLPLDHWGEVIGDPVITDLGSISLIVTSVGVVGALCWFRAARNTLFRFLFERPEWAKLKPARTPVMQPAEYAGFHRQPLPVILRCALLRASKDTARFFGRRPSRLGFQPSASG